MTGILIIMDGLGIGAMEDASDYGDSSNVNTLKSVLQEGDINDFPTLEKLGLFNLLSDFPKNGYQSISMKLNEASKGKDSITGHWEMMGVIRKKFFPVIGDFFPEKLKDCIENTIGRKVIGLKNISGTAILEQYGSLHNKIKQPIVYTSTDSVLQVAVNEKVIPLEVLYSWCKSIHDNLPIEFKVARVIARPFIETNNGFIRTENRRDFSLIIPKPNTLDNLYKKNIPLYSFGKISDLYNGIHFFKDEKMVDDFNGMERLIATYPYLKEGLLIINLNDFDSKYGHRRNVKGYYNALKKFDEQLTKLIKKMKKKDFLLLTADHGCDPLAKGTNHTREKVPYILFSDKLVNKYGYKGERNSFTIIGETLEKLFNEI